MNIMRTSCLQLERIKRIEVDQDPLTIHGKKDASVQSRLSWKNLRFKKKEESLAKTFRFSVISSYLCIFHLYPAGRLHLRWMSTHRNQETDANSHTYTFLRLRRYRTTGDVRVSDGFAWRNKAEMKASSRGSQFCGEVWILDAYLFLLFA